MKKFFAIAVAVAIAALSGCIQCNCRCCRCGEKEPALQQSTNSIPEILDSTKPVLIPLAPTYRQDGFEVIDVIE